MSIVLNHTIVPGRNKQVAAKQFAELFGLKYEGPMGPFETVRINESLTFDFEDRSEHFDSHHYAFHVSEQEFDSIFDRIKSASLSYGSGPFSLDDKQINHRRGGRGVYFRDADGHIWELMTAA